MRFCLKHAILVAASVMGVVPGTFAGVLAGPIIGPVNGHIYYLLTSESWTASEAEAVSLGGHLATINDLDENQWIANTFRPLTGSADPRLWIGLNDAAQEGHFVWASGEAVVFTYWDVGEPNNSGNEDFVVMRRPSAGPPDGAWNDISNGAAAFGVVEVVPVRVEPTGNRNVSMRFQDFANRTGLEFHGATTNAASLDGAVLRLVPAQTFQVGSAFSDSTVSPAAFSTFFTFRFTSPGGDGGGADGLVFVVTGSGQYFGRDGGGLGYQDLTNTVGVEFDIYNNSTDPTNSDSNASHIGIDVGGAFTFAPGETNTAPVSPDMKNGDRWFAWIDYDGSVLEARVSRAAIRPSIANVKRTVNATNEIANSVGKVGFTAGTGGGYANHDILSWQFNSTWSPIHAVLPGVSLQRYPLGVYIFPKLSITGSVGSLYQIQSADALASTNNWSPLANLVLTNNPSVWLDRRGLSASNRFYRVIPY